MIFFGRGRPWMYVLMIVLGVWDLFSNAGLFRLIGALMIGYGIYMLVEGHDKIGRRQ